MFVCHGNKLSLISTTTQEKSEFNGRLTEWLMDGRFEKCSGFPLNLSSDRVMICGSLDMLKDHKEI